MSRPLRERCPARAVLCAAALLLSALPAGADLAPGRHDRSLYWDGIERTYFIHVPPGYDGTAPTPLVLAIHGLSSDANIHQNLSGMSEVADENGFVVVYPNGVDRRWNAGICCAAPEQAQDDVGFLRAVVASVQDEVDVDPTRIYVTGLSNGGAMTHKLACEAADLFAAAAPVAFALPYSPITDCQPSRPIPVLNFMGLNDTLVPYAGAGAFNGALESFAQWRSNNACGDEPPEIVEITGGTDCTIDTSCADGVETGLCSVDSHSFPGTFFEGHILYVNDDIDVARTAWDFVSRFTVPEPSQVLLQGAVLATLALLRRRR
jgi:polyhydroxybutyrate depolymerase